ncbi:hypothetical protein D3C84_1225070 [compost metagenome]
MSQALLLLQAFLCFVVLALVYARATAGYFAARVPLRAAIAALPGEGVGRLLRV